MLRLQMKCHGGVPGPASEGVGPLSLGGAASGLLGGWAWMGWPASPPPGGEGTVLGIRWFSPDPISLSFCNLRGCWENLTHRLIRNLWLREN